MTSQPNLDNIVPGEGPDNALVMLIGQNPGKEEAKQRRPFVGRSGKFLDAVLKEIGLEREKLYITAAVKEPTHRNKKPRASQVKYWQPYLLSEIDRLKPKIIVLMGEIAWKTPRLPGIEYMETYHPAAAMRFPKVRQKFKEDFKQLRRKMRQLEQEG